MTRTAWCDVETTGTDPFRHHLWEVALVVRDDGEVDRDYCWQVRPDLTTADPMALKVGGYYRRNLAIRQGFGYVVAQPGTTDTSGPDEAWRTVSAAEVAIEVAHLLDGAVLAAANVAFDAAFVAKFLRANGQAPTWDYHLLEMESYAAGALGVAPPWKLDRLLAEFGLTLSAEQRHTALGDARAVRDLFDAAMLRNAAVVR